MSCLFQSIGALLQKNPQVVRNEIVDFIIENQESKLNDMKLKNWVLFNDNNQDFDEYTKSMRNPSEWGSALEIISAVILYDVKISIEYKSNVIEFGSDIIDESRPNLVLHYTGSHYTPLRIS